MHLFFLFFLALLFANDLSRFLQKSIGLAIGFSLVYWHAWRHSNDRDLQPTLLAVLPRATLPVRLA